MQRAPTVKSNAARTPGKFVLPSTALNTVLHSRLHRQLRSISKSDTHSLVR